jgi:3-methyl-2-oxobutanoate hydroxymethyltransferase
MIKKIEPKKKPWVCLTAYNKHTAEIIDPYCDMILVGDSMAMAYYGFKNTRSIGLNEVIVHAKSVRMGIKKSVMVVDMPYNTYSTPSVALKNAKKILKQTKCDAVKLEGGYKIRNIIKTLINHKIQVVGHIGLMPQAVTKSKDYRVKGKNIIEEKKILKDFLTLQSLGVSAIVIEAVKESVANKIQSMSSVITIGIGASKKCDGQILVTEDLLGMFEYIPRFVKKYANINKLIQRGVRKYSEDVISRKFPTSKNTY